jgi:polyisoprenoid-binding protein YceI
MSFRSLSAILLLAAIAAACAPAASPAEPAPAEPTTAAPQPTDAAPAEPTSAEVAAGPTTYTFVAGETIARFVIDEVLSGNPKTVIGETGGVSGSITLDLGAPAEAMLGPVEVDLSGLETDNGFRTRALHEAILQTGKDGNAVATFTATQIEGLPGTVTPGTAYELKITGDLTIKGTTRQVTFDATVTPVSADRIEGTATLTVPFADFGVDIPFLPPQVASVEDLVRLEIDLVAAR